MQKEPQHERRAPEWEDLAFRPGSSHQYWRFVEFESAATPIFSSSTGYGEHDTDGALVFSRLEMMGLFKIIADNTRQQLAALGVEVE